jgi:L-lactate transport
MWQQNYAPIAHSIGWSAIAAAAPIALLLFLLAVKRKPAWISAIASLGAASMVALLVYRMPPFKALASASLGASFGLLPIGWITLNSILLYRLTLETGQFEIIKNSLTNLSDDRRLQVLLIAFAFGSFIEGAAGSGVPVAVGAAMLTGLGFSPLSAATVCLVANTAPVAFGAIGTPVLTLAVTTGLPLAKLSAGIGRLCSPIALAIPAYLTVLVGGWKGLKGTLPAGLTCGISFAVVQFAVSNLIGPQLAAVIASIASLASLVLLLRFWRPKDSEFHLAPPQERVRYRSVEVFCGWLPYALLAGFVLAWGFPPVRSALELAGPSFDWPALHNQLLRMPPVAAAPTPASAQYKLEWLASPGTACLLASIVAAALAGLSPRTFAKVAAATLRQMYLPLITIASVCALAFLMNYCGAAATLGLAFAGTGKLFPFFGALLGWLGVFLTGSDASSNALFGNLQTVTASRLGLSPVLMASANSSGGVMGKMISVQTIAVASAATGMKASDEAQLLRFTFWRSVILASAIGLLTAFYAYGIPDFVR